MLFEDDGDIYFSDAFAATFTAQGVTLSSTPRVLIYHTHTQEAFRTAETNAAPVKPGDAETSAIRSTDPAQNVVRLGTLLTEQLTEYGFEVVHDVTDNEPPSLSTA